LPTTHHPPPHPTPHPKAKNRASSNRCERTTRATNIKTNHKDHHNASATGPKTEEPQRVMIRGSTRRTPLQRCSRPLCSSQQTTRHPTPCDPHQTPALTKSTQRYVNQVKPRPRGSDLHCSRSKEPGPSGPNSAPDTHPPRPLRSTQQSWGTR
jgi:hypothetical protein